MHANTYKLMIGAGMVFFLVAMSALNLEELEWKARKGPDRHEGIQMKLKGAQLELLSAAVLYKHEPRQGEELLGKRICNSTWLTTFAMSLFSSLCAISGTIITG